MSNVVLASERWGWHDRIFDNYTVDDGLPNGAIGAMAQDETGFMWLWSSEGLIRFDGHHFEHVSSPLLESDSVNVMLKGAAGQLWLGTNGGLIEFYPATRQFKHHQLSAEQSVEITDIAMDNNINSPLLWISTNEGIFKYNTQTRSAQPFLLTPLANSQTWRTFKVLSADDNSLWLATNHGLYYKKANASNLSLFDLSSKLPSTTRISALIQDSGGNIWLGTPSDGVLVIDSKMKLTQPKITNFANEWIYSLAEIRPGTIWLGSYGSGIIEMSIDGSNAARIENDRLNQRSLISNEIWHIFPDANGLVWTGTSGGLSRYDATQQSVKSLFGDITHRRSISDTNVNSMLEDNTGNVWLGLRKKGIDIINPVLGKTEHFAIDSTLPKSALPVGAIESLAINEAGDLFVGSNWGLYQHARSQLRRVEVTGRADNGYAGMVEIIDETIWVGGTDGLWKIDKLNQTKAHGQNLAAQFNDIRTTAIESIASDEFVVGTWRGLNWINDEGQFTYQLSENDKASIALSDSFISDMLYDRQDRLWVSTEGNGIFVGEEGKHPKRFIQLTKAQGLSSDIIRSMQFDDEGNVWVGGSVGIDVINPKSMNVKSLEAQDGVLFAPYYRQASLKTSQGELLFGGSGGVTVIDSQLLQEKTTDYSLAITAIHHGRNTSFDPNIGTSPSEPVVIAADDNELTVKFTSLDFAATTINYRYRLLGLNDQWQQRSENNRNAVFTTLPSGQYQLEIQASNRQGQWSTAPHIIHIQVLPFWYQTLWAKVTALVLICLLIVLIVKVRTQRLQKKQEYLEQEVNKRTLSLQKAKDELATISVTDPLTGMNNRRYLDSVMPLETENILKNQYASDSDCDRREGDELAFILIDIDHFKRVNDNYGHKAGDGVLVEITRRLRLIARETDHLVRWGGEEFLLVVRQSSAERAKNIAERIGEHVKREPIILSDNQQLKITCSIGFCAFPFFYHQPKNITWLECIDIADKALYSAKNSGRDAWVSVKASAHNSDEKTPLNIASISHEHVTIESNVDGKLEDIQWQSS